MRRILLLGAVLLILLPVAAVGQVLPKVTLFGGYTYMRDKQNGGSSFGLNGWDVSLEGKSFLWLGWVTDVSQQYGHPFAVDEKQTMALFGPQLSIPHIPRAVPFVHALFGVVHGTHSLSGIGISGSSSLCPVQGCPAGVSALTGTSFATAVGGGVDVKVAGPVWLRAIQVDYVHGDLSPDHHTQVRLAAGVAFRF
jgi:hypothetical protein